MSNFKKEIIKTPIEKVAVEKAKVEKVASFADKATALLGTGASAAVTAAATVGTAWLAQKGIGVLNSKLDASAYKESLDKALRLNPKLASIPRMKLEQYFNLIVESSPTVAKNPLLVANYLEYLIDNEGKINFNAYIALTNLEGQAQNNRNNANPFSSMAIKTYTEGAIKDNFAQVADARKFNNSIALEEMKGTKINKPFSKS